ncbi:helix-turn-helix domain-containing protein [Aureimonas glaciei]|uniref:AraC family transcriptional regulator n=1 Tax=Aureimonas glaciei TaxID=1776957 RepID=A0A917DD03_9HYPH|nr:AraC family transcriptional regulator [Aureimonas glaciei]GGD26399.1 AraC family transcriptional regulator [Aureimonas glaciei]
MTPRLDKAANRGELHGATLGAYLGIAAQPILRLSDQGRSRLAVTRLTLTDPRGYDRRAPTEPEDAYSLTYKLRPIERLEVWQNGRYIQNGGVAAETAKMIDLSEPSQSRITGLSDSVHVYIGKFALDDLAAEIGARKIDRLRMPSNEADPILGQFCRFMLASPPEAEPANPLFADQLALSLLTYFAERYGGLSLPSTKASAGGLAPWQERRAREIIHSRLATRMTMADVAGECRLTPSYFAKAFRQTFGTTPHRYLTEVRINEAKSYLLNSQLPLADIALLCGLGDQSYFTRVFTAAVGTSPGAWRRATRS